VAGAEALGDLDGHPPRVAGGPEHEHALPGLERDAVAQSDPGGHRGIHRGGDGQHVGVGLERHAASRVDDDPLGHAPELRVVEDEVAQLAIGVAADPVKTGDHR
jgi:hypothetical protein